MPSKISSSNKWIKLALAIIIVFISYGQTLLMYFWQDDSALIFKLQNPEGPAGSFGEGIIGSGAYKWLVTPFVPFYPLFGKDPFGYFLVGFLTYLIATYFFYKFLCRLFGNKESAYIGTLTFAAGYIGSDIMFRVINSWQTNIGLILTFILFENLVRYLKSSEIRYYWISVVTYWAATEFVFIRSHSLIVPIVLLDVLLRFNRKRFFELKNIIFRQIPFVGIFYIRYLTDSGFGGPGLLSIAKEIISGNFVVTAPFFASVGNVFVPVKIQEYILNIFFQNLNESNVLYVGIISIFIAFIPFCLAIRTNKIKSFFLYGVVASVGLLINLYFYDLRSLIYRTISDVFSGALGLQIALSLTLIWFTYRKWQKINLSYLMWGLVFVLTQVFGYYIQYPTAIFTTTHRYFSYALIGYSIIVVAVYQLVKKNYSSYYSNVMIVGVLGIHLYLGFSYQNHLVHERSIPSARFYANLLEYVPSIEKNSAFYFDVSRIPPFPQQFTDFFSVGSMPESTALAMYYDVDRYDVYYLTDFDETISKIVDNEFPLEKLYTFYLGKDGLIDTTADTRKLLQSPSESRSFPTLDTLEGNPLTPQMLMFELTLRKGDTPKEYVPFDVSKSTKQKILDYLSSKNDYYKTVTAISDSEWKYREVENVVDNNSNTVWQGHRIFWGDHEREELTIDLGVVRDVGAIVWTNWKTSLAPRSYSIEGSLDGDDWQELKNIPNGPERTDGERVYEDIDDTRARFIRMVITRTETNDSPALLEFETIDSRYADVDISLANSITYNPLSITSDVNEWNDLYNYAAKIALATITWTTDKSDVNMESQSFPIIIDSLSHNYSVYLPAGGTKMDSFSIEYSVPVNAKIGNITIANMTLEDLIAEDYVVRYSEN